LTRSSADSIGVSMRSMVRNAARLAVYDEMMMSVKNHQALPTIRPDNDLSHDPPPTATSYNINKNKKTNSVFIKPLTNRSDNIQ